MHRAVNLGSLCYERTFSRILGTRGVSEPILKDLICAWRAARTGSASAGGLDVEVLERQVLEGASPSPWEGGVAVDVRLDGIKDGYVFHVQLRDEVLFARRALLFAAADLIRQHLPSDGMGSLLRPVHTLAFSNFDYAAIPDGGATRAGLEQWRHRTSPPPAPLTERALHIYTLQPVAAAMADMGQLGSEALDAELASRQSIALALLPHAPRLEELTAATPQLLRWASIVANVAPDNLDAVPKAVRSEDVERLMSMLRDTADITFRERQTELKRKGVWSGLWRRRSQRVGPSAGPRRCASSALRASATTAPTLARSPPRRLRKGCGT